MMDFEIDLAMINDLEQSLCFYCKHYHECQKGYICETFKKYMHGGD